VAGEPWVHVPLRADVPQKCPFVGRTSLRCSDPRMGSGRTFWETQRSMCWKLL